VKYLGVPITTSRLTKFECSSLVEKILAIVPICTTRNISFLGRVRLINSAVFGMFNYWLPSFCYLMKSQRRSPKSAGINCGVEQMTIRKCHISLGNTFVCLKLKGDWVSRTLQHGTKLILQN